MSNPVWTQLIAVGSQPDYNRATGKMAYSKRNAAGWMQIRTCTFSPDNTLTNDANLTDGIDFWAGQPGLGTPSGIQRHVGLAHWDPLGRGLLLCVEDYDQTAGASTSSSVGDHRTRQPGSGIGDSIYFITPDGARWWRLITWNGTYGGSAAISSMQAFFSPDGSQITCSVMRGTGGSFGDWDGLVAPFTFTDGIPALGTATTFDPCEALNSGVAHMNEPNCWYSGGIGYSCNPRAGQAEGVEDVCIINPVDGTILTNLTSSRGAAYREHAVVSPDGLHVAYMSGESLQWTQAGTELWIANIDGSSAFMATRFNLSGFPGFLGFASPATSGTTGHPTWVDNASLIIDFHNTDNTDGTVAGMGPIVLVSGLFQNARWRPASRTQVNRTQVNRTSATRVAIP